MRTAPFALVLLAALAGCAADGATIIDETGVDGTGTDADGTLEDVGGIGGGSAAEPLLAEMESFFAQACTRLSELEGTQARTGGRSRSESESA